jgi:hypothetical protein
VVIVFSSDDRTIGSGASGAVYTIGTDHGMGLIEVDPGFGTSG